MSERAQFQRSRITPMQKEDKAKPRADSAPAVTEQEDRRITGPRHTVSAVAQIVELRSGTRVNMRISDLSLGGCYIDSMSPLQIGTEIRLGLLKDKKIIEVNGTVIYSHPGLGMGVSFARATAEQRAEIEKWVSDLTEKNTGPVTLETMPNQPSEAATEYKILLKLIHLLIAKGILAEDEARDILNKPIF